MNASRSPSDAASAPSGGAAPEEDGVDVAALRESYRGGTLERGDLTDDPLEQFRRWLDDAVAAEIPEPNAMTLATSDPSGRVAARMVLLKGVGDDGFVFYTNYGSAKAADLDANPRAALVFWWAPLERQVRVEGRVERTSRERSRTYFESRPHGSQLGAWVSRQSREIESRETLEARLADLEARWEAGGVPLPEFWGGYRVVPDRIEFWQGRESRLHDRFVYRRAPDARFPESDAADADGETPGGWRVARLAP